MGLCKIKVATQVAPVFTDAVRIVLNQDGNCAQAESVLRRIRESEINQP